jgi:hypothetical protein
VPLVCNIKIEMDTARVTLITQPRTRCYVVLYGAINTAKLDVSNPRYILDKIAFKEKRY